MLDVLPKHKSCKYFREEQLYLSSLNHQFPQYFHHSVPLLFLHIIDAFRRQKLYGMVYKAQDFEMMKDTEKQQALYMVHRPGNMFFASS